MIHIRVQHAAGRETLPRLLERLPVCEVITDEEASLNPFEMYKRCLRDLPAGTSHVVVLQDDALPCVNLAGALQRAVAEKPHDPISLFVGGLTNTTRKLFFQAQKRGDAWSTVYFSDIHHVVAICWPVNMAERFLAWSETARIPLPKPIRSDDAVVGYWARTSHATFRATVPCLVEHPDDGPSLVRPKVALGDRGRMAIAFCANGDDWPYR